MWRESSKYSSLLKKPHKLRCASSIRFNVLKRTPCIFNLMNTYRHSCLPEGGIDRLRLGRQRPQLSQGRPVLPPKSSNGCLGYQSPNHLQG
jgi:hypothetical protein